LTKFDKLPAELKAYLRGKVIFLEITHFQSYKFVLFIRQCVAFLGSHG